MQFYYGGHKRYGNSTEVFACWKNDEGKTEMEEIKHVVRHSPSGMTWGYGGSGPADCALSILTDFSVRLGHEIDVERLYQAFKWEVIAHSIDDELHISSELITEWLTRRKAIPEFWKTVPK